MSLNSILLSLEQSYHMKTKTDCGIFLRMAPVPPSPGCRHTYCQVLKRCICSDCTVIKSCEMLKRTWARLRVCLTLFWHSDGNNPKVRGAPSYTTRPLGCLCQWGSHHSASDDLAVLAEEACVTVCVCVPVSVFTCGLQSPAVSHSRAPAVAETRQEKVVVRAWLYLFFILEKALCKKKIGEI